LVEKKIFNFWFVKLTFLFLRACAFMGSVNFDEYS